MLKLAALESTKNLDLEKKEGRIDDLLRVRRRSYSVYYVAERLDWAVMLFSCKTTCLSAYKWWIGRII